MMPIEIYQVILERSNFLSQIRLTELCKYFHNNLKIYDFININKKITDEGISHMNLHILDAEGNSKITDKGISHMKLHTLNAASIPWIENASSNITDNGIKNMNLHELYAHSNTKITDEGIRHM